MDCGLQVATHVGDDTQHSGGRRARGGAWESSVPSSQLTVNLL